MKSIIIDFSAEYIRTALTEDNILTELLVDSYESTFSLGNIFIGIVKNILPSQFAFIDIGHERNAFLNLNDKKEAMLYENGKLQLKQGQKILVQLLKNSSGIKGETVTTQLNFSDRNVVLYSNSSGEVGISKKISSKAERNRLKKIAKNILPERYGIIIRTNSQDKDEEEITNSVQKLLATAVNVLDYSKYSIAPALVYKENFILAKTIKDLISNDIGFIAVNSAEYFAEVKELAGKLTDRENIVMLHDFDMPIFVKYGLEHQIDSLINKKIWLKSGGFIVIEQTEACVVIDVNTGKYLGNKNQRKSMLNTNLEAAVEIARQIRLRNLSGQIIIDFIDLHEAEDRERLIKVLAEETKRDRINVNIVGMTQLGLMQLTRKKARSPLLECLTMACPHCGGTGRSKGGVCAGDRERN